MFIGPNACVLGEVNIGNNVAIAANVVVLDDVPDTAVMAGNPAVIVSNNGSNGLISSIHYDDEGNFWLLLIG